MSSGSGPAAFSKRSISLTEMALGNLFGAFGGLTVAATSTSRTPSKSKNLCSPRTAARVLATEVATIALLVTSC